MAEPAVEIRRGDRVESIVRADVVVVDCTGRLVAWIGDPERQTYWRSAAKPFQAIPVITSGAAATFQMGAEDLAVVCASHGGEPSHVTHVMSLLERVGASPAQLILAPRWPTHHPSAEALRNSNEKPQAVHNSCSGKHSGMLALAAQLGAPFEGYEDINHPVQEAVRRVVALYTGYRHPGSIHVGGDGCGVPTFYLPLCRMAWAFARLVDPRGLPDAEARAGLMIAEAMRHHPALVASEGRWDAALAEAIGQRLVIKTGLEAVCCLGVPERGWGIAIKIEDGSSRAISALTTALLAVLGILTDDEARALSSLAQPSITNHAGRVVGEMVPVFEMKWGRVS